jgi:putative endonuclease
MPASWRARRQPMPDARRVRAERQGRWAELAALWSLRLKGYRLLAHRYKSPHGEVDLIMRRGQVTAFIEVKARRSTDLGIECVTPFQARRISAAARSWMGRDLRAARDFCRFDIVAVSPYHWPRHVENAFYGDD